MSYKTNEEIYKAIMSLKKELDELKDSYLEANIGELSLYKASKLVKKSPEYLKSEADKKRLAAEIKKKNGIKTYRFRVCDLHEWQKKRFKKINDDIIIDSNEIFDPKKFVKYFHERERL